MSQPGRLVNIDDRCEYIRWKGLYVDGEQNYYTSQSGDRLFWCVKTQNCLGPDGRLVSDYECSAGRGCYRQL